MKQPSESRLLINHSFALWIICGSINMYFCALPKDLRTKAVNLVFERFIWKKVIRRFNEKQNKSFKPNNLRRYNCIFYLTVIVDYQKTSLNKRVKKIFTMYSHHHYQMCCMHHQNACSSAVSDILFSGIIVHFNSLFGVIQCVWLFSLIQWHSGELKNK